MSRHKVVINACYGGFELSAEAIKQYRDRTGYTGNIYEVPRHDPVLIDIVETLGDAASGFSGKLRIHTLYPGDTAYRVIDEYDGMERLDGRDDEGWVIL